MTAELDPDVAAVLEADDPMADLVARHGPVTVTPAEHPFQRLVVSIVNQSISTAAADSIREDLFSAFEQPIAPEAVMEYGEEPLAAIVGGQKAEYIRNVAGAYADGAIAPDVLREASEQAVVQTLTEIRGVGRWTADMYLLFVLGRDDVFPIGDLGVRRGMVAVYGDMSREEMVEKARDWEPYRSYATKYLWLEYES